MTNIDILPEEEEKKSWSWEAWEFTWEVISKIAEPIADVTEELSRWVVAWIPKLWTFAIDTIVNWLDIGWDMLAMALDFGSWVFAWYKNEKQFEKTWTKWTAKGSSFAEWEWFLDRLNAESDKATTAIDEAVDTFLDKPEFNRFHTLDDTMMKDILNFTWETVSYFVWGKWVTIPAKMIFAGKNSKQAQTLIRVIAENQKLAKTKWLVPAVQKIASKKANDAKTILEWFVKSWRIVLKDPNKWIVTWNIIAKWVGDWKYISKLVTEYDKAFGKAAWAVKSTLWKHKLATAGWALVAWAIWAVDKDTQQDVKENLWEVTASEDKWTWESIVEAAWDAWENVTEQIDTALTGNIYWDKTKEFFKTGTDMTQELFWQIKTKFSQLEESEQNIISEKLGEWNSAGAMNLLSGWNFNLRTNIELPWLLEWEEAVFYNWVDWNIWAMKDWDKKTLDENISTYNDAELAEGNMQDYVVVYYK